MERQYIALIPAYKPEELLLPLILQVKKAGFVPIVVDDGSGIRFAPLFERCRELAVVLTHPQNRGKGAALKTGFEYIRQHFSPQDIVVALDADGQHRVDDAKKVCLCVREHPESLVLGSRRRDGSVPLRSRLGGGMTRGIFFLSTGKRIYDTQTGLRGCTVERLCDLAGIEGERYEYEMNVLLTLARRGVPIREVEIETVYLNHNAASHFRPVGDSVRIYREILGFCASSFAAFLVDFILYSLLTSLTTGWGAGGLWLSNLTARVVSAGLNFTINRRLVFRSRGNLGKAAAQYFLLACCTLIGNTLLIQLLTQGLGVNRYVAKLCAEIFFFMVNWLIQRLVVFRTRTPSCP